MIEAERNEKTFLYLCNARNVELQGKISIAYVPFIKQLEMWMVKNTKLFKSNTDQVGIIVYTLQVARWLKNQEGDNGKLQAETMDNE